MDFGPIFSTFGYNDVEGQRLRVGGRTYFGSNDTWRIQGYTAYGFKDNKFKNIGKSFGGSGETPGTHYRDWERIGRAHV